MDFFLVLLVKYFFAFDVDIFCHLSVDILR